MMGRSNNRSGQTMIIALLILGVLLILGFVFTGLIARNIRQSSQSHQRTVANDLAEAGIRLAHYQLLNSELGADWKPENTPPPMDAQGISRDPDALYLRQATNFPLRSGADPVIDKGGPDGLGPYSRFSFDKGRALVRVRYAPADFGNFTAPSGAMKQPGKARSYLILEAIGRPGRVNTNDPSTLTRKGVKVGLFMAGQEALMRASLGELKQTDVTVAESRKVMAFASIGIIETARFITNVHRVSNPAEIGSLTAAAVGNDRDGLGITYENQPVNISTQYGGDLFNKNGTFLFMGTGSLYSNAALKIHGNHRVMLNQSLGDFWGSADSIRPANAASSMDLIVAGPAGTNVYALNSTQLDSRNPNFLTYQGMLRDGQNDADPEGFTRSNPYKDPPSIIRTDPSTNSNRYVVMTRDSGTVIFGRNSGRWGHGSGVYVDCRERGNLADETQREQSGVLRSLQADWLNPNNSASQAWQGPFYRPLAPYVRLLPDGFEIIRDSRARERFWRLEDGTRTTFARCRYRLRQIMVGGNLQTYIINSIKSPNLADLPAGSLQNTDFVNSGRPFNGVIFFEGDVRVRGVIPTNHQLSVVSMGSIYIEGSITKGVVTESGATLSEPSTSMLMLMAKDYVTINTTQFFAPAPGEDPKAKNADKLPDTPNPVELDLTETPQLTLQAQFLLNSVPNATNGTIASNPTTWKPFATQYTEFGSRAALTPNMLLTHAADDDGPSLISLSIAAQTFADTLGSVTAPYLFARSAIFNTEVGALFSGTGNIPIYGLTQPARNAFPRFETIGLPLADQTYTYTNRQMSKAGSAWGNYALGVQDETHFTLKLTALGGLSTKNYELARAAVVPHDIRIEAALFAEEGSFFVIPGPAFNTNIQDRRDVFDADVSSVGLAVAQQRRFENFGSSPSAPFYGEPLNVRISIVGAVSENMPPPMSVQAEWQRKWGWMPRYIGGTSRLIPEVHVPNGYNVQGANPQNRFVPNIVINYDPALALASADGLVPIRTTPDGLWTLPPMPRLPVSSTLVYFGEAQP